MSSLIFKEQSTRLNTKSGYFVLKGGGELNIVEESLYKELLECNPQMKEWQDKGYLIVSSRDISDNIKADISSQKTQEDIKRTENAVKTAKTINKGGK